jgi:iron complex transport system substrate-binding protein
MRATVLLLALGCGESLSHENSIPSHPSRILPLSVAVAEVVMDLVSRDRIVGMPEQAAVPSFSNISDRTAGLPLVSAEAERIVALRPDLVILASYAPEGLLSVLRRAGVPVRTVLAPHDLEGVASMIVAVGTWTGEQEQAQAMIRRLRSDMAEVRAAIPPGILAPRVVSLQGFGTTAGAETSFDAWARLAGARNLAAENGVRGFQSLSIEHLFAWAPDVLVVGLDPRPGSGIRARILSDPLYGPLRSCRILEIPFPHFTCVSQHAVEPVRDLVRGLYP